MEITYIISSRSTLASFPWAPPEPHTTGPWIFIILPTDFYDWIWRRQTDTQGAVVTAFKIVLSNLHLYKSHTQNQTFWEHSFFVDQLQETAIISTLLSIICHFWVQRNRKPLHTQRNKATIFADDLIYKAPENGGAWSQISTDIHQYPSSSVFLKVYLWKGLCLWWLHMN